jgi:hypothetical protein
MVYMCKETNMARKPLGPFSIVPQFDDMLGELGGYVKMPPENHVSEILGDPIFQALGNMWNRIESSEELVVKHQANEVAYMQGAANVGIPIDVMRKLVARVAQTSMELHLQPPWCSAFASGI